MKSYNKHISYLYFYYFKKFFKVIYFGRKGKREALFYFSLLSVPVEWFQNPVDEASYPCDTVDHLEGCDLQDFCILANAWWCQEQPCQIIVINDDTPYLQIVLWGAIRALLDALLYRIGILSLRSVVSFKLFVNLQQLCAKSVYVGETADRFEHSQRYQCLCQRS